ncbi:MAG: hypothetical protein P8176_13640 [Gammaproteobacteria bacterium]
MNEIVQGKKAAARVTEFPEPEVKALSGDELTKVKGRIQGYDRKAKTE